MSVRCLQCGSTLIHEAAGHSDTYKKTVEKMDRRVYGGVGGFFGFFLVAGILRTVFSDHWLTDADVYGAAMVGSIAGTFLGRAFLRFKRGSL